jgi:hypothetical protein
MPLLPFGTFRHDTMLVLKGMLVTEDQLLIFFSGRAKAPENNYGGMHDGSAATGFGYLRRDGFASVDAYTGVANVTTKPLAWSHGDTLWVNFAGEGLQVEILNASTNAVIVTSATPGAAAVAASSGVKQREGGWSTRGGQRANGGTFTGDSTRQSMIVGINPALLGKTVRLRFRFATGSLYSFWFGSQCGESRGYVASGGSEFNSTVDLYGSC